jgi:uncharacterized protein (TIGR00730 family)
MTQAIHQPLVAVYCGSRSGHQPHYQQIARQLGQALALAGFGLVYGGASIGLMGQVADAVLADGGPVLGVIPDFLMDHEIAHHHLTELQVVPTMHARKAIMAERASAYVAIAGGWGTLEELTEMVSWQQLGQHNKPIILLNTDGYFDGLIMQLQRAVDDGFMSVQDQARLLVCTEVQGVLDVLIHQQQPARVLV